MFEDNLMYEALAELLGVEAAVIELIESHFDEDTGSSGDFH